MGKREEAGVPKHGRRCFQHSGGFYEIEKQEWKQESEKEEIIIKLYDMR